MASDQSPLRSPKTRVAVNYLLIILAISAVAASVGLWWWNTHYSAYQLRLAAGIELTTRKGLVETLVNEAARQELQIQVQSRVRSVDALDLVARGQLDAAVVPAGLSYPADEIRQVAVFDREPLQLFVRPEILPYGIAGLRGKRISLGSPGSGVRAIAGDVLAFVGLKPEEDYKEMPLPYADLRTKVFPVQQMPEAIFLLSPLPSPLGERLANVYGYQLMELPFGAAMALRRPSIEDVVVPAYTYGTCPPAPDKPLHTLGTRALLVAHSKVPPAAIRRLLEVLYEGDLARQAGMPPLDDTLIRRQGEYPHHPGTIAYVHRSDSWLNNDLIRRLKELSATGVSAFSALLLLWQWYRRRGVSSPGDYLRACTRLELEAQRALYDGSLDQTRLDTYLARATRLRIDVLEKHQAGLVPADATFATVLSRLDYLHETLTRLLPALPENSLASLTTAARRPAA